MQSKGANTNLIASLLLRTAEVELKIGQQDSNLRAHNLARQAFDRNKAHWEALLAAKSRAKKSNSWWPGTASEPSPDSVSSHVLEGSPRPEAYKRVRSYGVWAAQALRG